MRLLRRRKSMRADWDARARKDAAFYVFPEVDSELAFEESGRRELDEVVLKGVVLPPRAVAVEIGCGVGRLAKVLAPRVGKIYACDLSAEMLSRARTYCAGAANVDFLRVDGDLAPIVSETADFVYSHLVFQHVPAARFIRSYVRESFRVLKRGGIFRFNVDGRNRQWYRRWAADSWSGVVFSQRRLQRELASAGFEIRDLSGGGTQYLWATARKPV
jgi:SAM-dependent methyltransferase